ncbi:MAG: cell envelope integrity protein TolA [Rhizobiaceae bacterium]
MKFPASLSTLMHMAVLAWGLLSLSAPNPLSVADVESLPIDIVPIEELTKAVQGEKKADVGDKPAPKPTQRPQEVPEARNVGEAKVDEESNRVPEPTPDTQNNQRAEAPPEAEKPEPAPQVKPEPVPEPVKESQPEKTTEVAALNQPKEPVPTETPDESAAQPEPSEEFAKLPEKVPVPQTRPEPPKPKSAETQERKETQEPPKPEQTATSDQKRADTTDKIAALLNKEKPKDSGAKRSTDREALGTKKASNAEKLSQSEMDALRGAIERCWSVPAGISDAEDMRVTIRMRLTRDGAIEGDPEVEATGGESGARRAFAGSARRAVLKCAPYQLPADKYDTWADVVVNFDPSQMF